MSGPFKMKGHALPGINQRSPAKDLGHGGHEGLSQEKAAKRTHGDKMSDADIKRRKKRGKRARVAKVFGVDLGAKKRSGGFSNKLQVFRSVGNKWILDDKSTR